jgi:hypothetical protein
MSGRAGRIGPKSRTSGHGLGPEGGATGFEGANTTSPQQIHLTLAIWIRQRHESELRLEFYAWRVTRQIP